MRAEGGARRETRSTRVTAYIKKLARSTEGNTDELSRRLCLGTPRRQLWGVSIRWRCNFRDGVAEGFPFHWAAKSPPAVQGMLASAKIPPVPLNSLTPNEPLIRLCQILTSYMFNPLSSSKRIKGASKARSVPNSILLCFVYTFSISTRQGQAC